MVATSTDKLSSMPKPWDINAQRLDAIEKSVGALNRLTANQSAKLEMALLELRARTGFLRGSS